MAVRALPSAAIPTRRRQLGRVLGGVVGLGLGLTLLRSAGSPLGAALPPPPTVVVTGAPTPAPAPGEEPEDSFGPPTLVERPNDGDIALDAPPAAPLPLPAPAAADVVSGSTAPPPLPRLSADVTSAGGSTGGSVAAPPIARTIVAGADASAGLSTGGSVGEARLPATGSSNGALLGLAFVAAGTALVAGGRSQANRRPEGGQPAAT